jgi:hypothetical protein
MATRPKAPSGNPFLPLVLDVAIPLGSYYLLRHFGVSLVMALAVSGLLPCGRVIWSTVRERTTDGLALAVLVLTLISIPVAFITGSPKVMLAKESLGTGPMGCWVIVSALLHRPAMANSLRAFLARTEGSALAWEQLSQDSARFRACLDRATLVWGTGFIVECAARLVLIIVLPVQTAVWAVSIPAIVVLSACVFAQGPWAMRLSIMIRQRVAENDGSNQMPVALAC